MFIRRFSCAAALAAGLAFTAVTPALAQTATPEPAPIGAGPSVGSLGVGIQLEKSFAGGQFGARIVTGNYNFGANGTSDGLNYNGNVQLSNVALLGDLHPFKGGFRLSGGVVLGNSKLTATGTPSAGQTFTVNNTVYSAADVAGVTGGIKLGTAPIVTLGWGGGNARRGQVQFTADIGAIFYSPTSTLNAQFGPNAAVSGVNDPTTPAGALFQQNLNKTRGDLKNVASYLTTYPVIDIGLLFHF